MINIQLEIKQVIKKSLIDSFNYDCNVKNISIEIQHYYETHNILYTYVKNEIITIHLYEVDKKCPRIDPSVILRICEFMINISGRLRNF